jgi:glycosyltransferase involved in cell wall biosynthesis
MFRFHCLGIPHTKTHRDFSHCAYTQKVWKFCKMMKDRGHYVIHYGVEGSDPPCDENVNVVSDSLWRSVYGSVEKQTSKFFGWSQNDAAYQQFFKRTTEEVNKRKQKGDFMLPFFGLGAKPVCDAVDDVIVVEPGIGYPDGHFAKYRVFESHAMMHAAWGLEKVRRASPFWYDRVIPNYFDLDEFDFCDEKEDYFLYIGRVYVGKGVGIAIDACRQMGVKLKVAGHLDQEFKEGYGDDWDKWVEYCGPVLPARRNELMGKALGTFAPTFYVEPFGGVQVEAMLCGTPTMTTDFGAFVENNIHGVTGYRCWTHRDFCQAIERLCDGQIDYRACRAQGEKFSLENVAPKYESFFRDIHDVELDRGGWYSLA